MLPESFEQRDVAIGDIAFILDMFADKVYSNKERAVIRELACNAHDSHVMVNADAPFDVHLPTQLEPWFSLLTTVQVLKMTILLTSTVIGQHR